MSIYTYPYSFVHCSLLIVFCVFVYFSDLFTCHSVFFFVKNFFSWWFMLIHLTNLNHLKYVFIWKNKGFLLYYMFKKLKYVTLNSIDMSTEKKVQLWAPWYLTWLLKIGCGTLYKAASTDPLHQWRFVFTCV